MDTCQSSRDTIVSAFSGDGTIPGLTRIAGDDDSCNGGFIGGSTFTFAATAGTTYYIQAGTYRPADAEASYEGPGPFTLQIEPAAPTDPSVDLGAVEVGRFGAAHSVAVTNHFTESITLGDASVTGVDIDDVIETSGTTCRSGQVLAVGDSCAYRLRYAPSATGSLTASLNVPYTRNAVATSSQVTLTGTGIDPTPGPAGPAGTNGAAGATGPRGPVGATGSISCRVEKYRGKRIRVRCTVRVSRAATVRIVRHGHVLRTQRVSRRSHVTAVGGRGRYAVLVTRGRKVVIRTSVRA